MPDLTIPAADGSQLGAYLGRPTVGSGPWPGIVIVHDVFGLTTVAREHADRLAAAGYPTVTPDLYSRGGMRRCVRETLRAVTSGQGRAYEDLGAQLRRAAEGSVRPRRGVPDRRQLRRPRPFAQGRCGQTRRRTD